MLLLNMGRFYSWKWLGDVITSVLLTKGLDKVLSTPSYHFQFRIIWGSDILWRVAYKCVWLVSDISDAGSHCSIWRIWTMACHGYWRLLQTHGWMQGIWLTKLLRCSRPMCCICRAAALTRIPQCLVLYTFRYSPCSNMNVIVASIFCLPLSPPMARKTI